MHVHIDHDNCMEVVIMTGRSDELQRIADRLLGLRGVKHGGIEIVTGLGSAVHARKSPRARLKTHASAHGHAHKKRAD
jgi:hypothetical protein